MKKVLLLFISLFMILSCSNDVSSNVCQKTNNGVEICDGIDNDCDGVIDAGECSGAKHCEDNGATLTCVENSKTVSCKDINDDKNKVSELKDVEVTWTDNKWSEIEACKTKCNENRTGENCETCEDGYQDNDNDGACKEICLVTDCSKSWMTGECILSDAFEASCICIEGHKGENCDEAIEGYQDNDNDGKFEKSCSISELTCDGNQNMTGLCKDETGRALCECKDAYSGENCIICAEGYQDNDNDGICNFTCETTDLICDGLNMSGECNDETGTSTCLCDAGYKDDCSVCDINYQDNDNNGTCEPDCNITCLDENQSCSDITGLAICRCADGYQDLDNNGTCLEDCSLACQEDNMNSCDASSGIAICGCEENYSLSRYNTCEFQGVWESDKEIKEAKIITDSLGNLYLSGWFSGSFDFDFSEEGVDTKTSASTGSIYLTKINADTSYAWTKIIATSNKMGKVNTITVDNNNNIYIAGHFLGSINFGLLSGVDENYLAAENNNGSGVVNTDIFITKIGEDANYKWTKVIGGNYADSALSIATSSDALYVTGYFQDLVDFDYGVGVDEKTSVEFTLDMFVTKINLDGEYVSTELEDGSVWREVGSFITSNQNEIFCINNSYLGEVIGYSFLHNESLDSYGFVKYRNEYRTYSDRIKFQSIAFDSSNNIYTVGYFNNIVDFNFTSGTDRHFSRRYDDSLFLMKINSNKTFNNAKSIQTRDENSYIRAKKVLVDNNNNIYIIGEFNGTADFNFLSNEVDERVSNGTSYFIIKVDEIYNYKWTEVFDDFVITDAVLDKNGSMYLSGYDENNVFFIKKRNMLE